MILRMVKSMCGIVGVTGTSLCKEILIEGLEKLEYRGYDSAGVYINDLKGDDFLVKRVGRIANLKEALTPEVQGETGIGHTRWATHGVPTEANAHPHFSNDERFYLVHNGVIDNFTQLRDQYLVDVDLKSETDTEVIVQLVDYFVVNQNMTTKNAFLKVLDLISAGSSYAFVLVDRTTPDVLYVAKYKSPLLIGLGDGFNLVASDAIAMVKRTNNFMEIQDREMVIVTPTDVQVTDFAGNIQKPVTFKLDIDPTASDLGAYPFFMLKEMDEQPAVMHKIAQTYFVQDGELILDAKLLETMKQADKIYLVGAGTSYHAGLVGAKMFEQLTGIQAEAYIASEFAYDQPIMVKKPFFIFLTQSGETADSREVLVNVKKQGWPSLTITNVAKSTLSREADFTMLLHAGPEIAVASTKAYTAQIAVQAVLAKGLGEYLNNANAQNFDLRQQLGLVAVGMQTIIDSKEQISELANKYLVNSKNAFYIGRGTDWTVALEAALKLKEISYVQAEGFASGELKHGTIALIEDNTPVIGIITQQRTAALTRSNLHEVLARGASVITIALSSLAVPEDTFVLPDVDALLTPLLSVVPAQLLAYYTSLGKGLDVDKPRNLAKSVTVQ